MNHTLLILKIKALLAREDGQDLMEYALIAALIALGCTAGLQSLAAAVNAICFNNAAGIISNTY
jgi:pilus assembly protein Flp/PilA